MENFSKKLETKGLTNSIRIWIFKKTKQIHHCLSKIYLFGSIARGTPNPNDCDIFFVIIPEHSENQWALIRNKIQKIKLEFVKKFNLPLSPILLTHNEWTEFQDFFGYGQIMIFYK
jgi:predicted nucleotidyltransferase